jgi:hypothetical protein
VSSNFVSQDKIFVQLNDYPYQLKEKKKGYQRKQIEQNYEA